MQQVRSCFHISLVYRSSLEAYQCPTPTIEENALFNSWFRCSTPTQLYDQQVRKILHRCRLVWSFVKSQNKEIAVLEVHGRPWFSNVLQLKMHMIILMWIYSQVKKPVKCRINEKCTKTRVCLQKKKTFPYHCSIYLHIIWAWVLETKWQYIFLFLDCCLSYSHLTYRPWCSFWGFNKFDFINEYM